MRPIRNHTDIESLKTDEELIECFKGDVSYYKFLCLHPRNKNYVILLDHCEQPIRVHYQELLKRFYTDYSQRDILTYRRDYLRRQADLCEISLSMLNDMNNKED